MTAGLQIISDFGTTQIDENFRSLFVVAEGQLGQESFEGTVPLIARQQPPPGSSGLVSGKWWRFDVLPPSGASNYGFVVYNAAGQRTFDARARPMRIVDSFQGTFSGPDTSWRGTRTYPAGRQYAVICCASGFYQHEQSDFNGTGKDGVQLWLNTYVWRNSIAYVQGNQVITDWYDIAWDEYETQNTPDFGYVKDGTTREHNNASFIVVDVTGY